MGFRMSGWDGKLIKYGKKFESDMMDLAVNIPLEEALDRGWKILAECFDPGEINLRSDLIKKFWPDHKDEKDEVEKETGSDSDKEKR